MHTNISDLLPLLPMQLYILILLILELVQLEVEVLLESTTVQVYYWRGVGGVHLFCGQPAWQQPL